MPNFRGKLSHSLALSVSAYLSCCLSLAPCRMMTCDVHCTVLARDYATEAPRAPVDGDSVPRRHHAVVLWPCLHDWEQRQRGARRAPPQSTRPSSPSSLLLIILYYCGPGGRSVPCKEALCITSVPENLRTRRDEGRASSPSGQGAQPTGASDQQELAHCTECPLRARRVFALVRFLPLSLLPRDEL